MSEDKTDLCAPIGLIIGLTTGRYWVPPLWAFVSRSVWNALLVLAGALALAVVLGLAIAGVEYLWEKHAQGRM